MKVLIGCEFSGTVRDAFLKKGHDVISCDLLPTEKPGPHYQGDIMNILDSEWDLLIAHPECTYLTNSGVRWLHQDPQRWIKLFIAAEFFKKLLDSDIPHKCIENPIQHKYAKQLIGVTQTQVVQPWMFGHPEKKATALWLDGLEPLVPTNNVKEEMEKLPKNQQQRMFHLPPSKNRWKLRSITYQGIADAMAEQWG